MTISPEYRARLIVMAKYPVAGRVKTRLGTDIGMTNAAWWYRHQTAALLRSIQHPAWQTILAPARTYRPSRCRYWPLNLPILEQRPGDLGQRMRHLFGHMPPGPAVIIGSDIPGVQSRHIRQAFSALGRNDAVFGPAKDGGYWLVGFRHSNRCPAGAFTNVRWSGKHALTDSMKSLKGLSIAQVAELADVDTGADLGQR